jgi:hypothetical protein
VFKSKPTKAKKLARVHANLIFNSFEGERMEWLVSGGFVNICEPIHSDHFPFKG